VILPIAVAASEPIFEIEYGQHGMKTRVKSKAGSLRPVKYADCFMESYGFRVITMLPLRASFNASWFIDGNLAPLLEKFPRLGGVQGEENRSCASTMRVSTTQG
jgi:hypothetical protein